MKNQSRIILFIAVAMISMQVMAQQRTITGKVTAFQKVGLSNIKVSAKKAGTETITDKYGQYSIVCAKNDVLSFRSEAFENIKKNITYEPDVINVNLYFAETSRNKEAAIQLGYLSKDTLEFAIVHLPNQKEDFSMYTDIFTLLKAKFPYLQISGDKRIAGLVFNTGTVLMIVDGSMVNDISSILPREVVSIEVLKRPDETTIYGINGGNGVIVIKTRRNK